MKLSLIGCIGYFGYITNYPKISILKQHDIFIISHSFGNSLDVWLWLGVFYEAAVKMSVRAAVI